MFHFDASAKVDRCNTSITLASCSAARLVLVSRIRHTSSCLQLPTSYLVCQRNTFLKESLGNIIVYAMDFIAGKIIRDLPWYFWAADSLQNDGNNMAEAKSYNRTLCFFNHNHFSEQGYRFLLFGMYFIFDINSIVISMFQVKRQCNMQLGLVIFAFSLKIRQQRIVHRIKSAKPYWHFSVRL